MDQLTDARSFLQRGSLYSAFPSPVGCRRRLPALEKMLRIQRSGEINLVFAQTSDIRGKIWRMRGPNYRGKDRSAAPLIVSTRQER